jgi:PPP family 3-phenylpropionic acid transporter
MLQSFFWCAVCFNSGFFALFLDSKGYQDYQIGVLFSIGSLSLMLGQFFWGAFCYKRPWLSHKHILLYCFTIVIGLNFVYPFASQHILLLILLFAIYTFTMGSMSSMIDAWTLFRKLDSPYIHYGLTRGIASAMYAITAIVFGYVFRTTGIEVMFLFSSIFIGAAMLFIAIIDRGRLEESHVVTQNAGFGAVKTLMINKKFMILLISVFFIFTAFIVNGNFYGPLILELGGTTSEFGIGMFIMAFSEMPLMLMSGWLLKKFSARIWLVISFFFFTVKSFLLAYSNTLSLAVLAQLAQAFSYGIFLPAVMVYLTQIVKKSEVTVALMVIASISFGLGGFLGNLLSGFISEHFGLIGMLRLIAILPVLGLLLFWVSLIYPRHSLSEQELSQ